MSWSPSRYPGIPTGAGQGREPNETARWVFNRREDGDEGTTRGTRWSWHWSYHTDVANRIACSDSFELEGMSRVNEGYGGAGFGGRNCLAIRWLPSETNQNMPRSSFGSPGRMVRAVRTARATVRIHLMAAPAWVALLA